MLDLRVKLSKELGREIGVFPETKHPTYFRRLGLELESPLVRTLRRNDLDRRGAKVFIQSFEAHNLEALYRRYRVEVPLVFLTSTAGGPFGDPRSYADYVSPAGLRELSRYAQGIGPDKFLPADFRVGTDPNAYGRAIDEQVTFFKAGLDGLFTDQADIGVLSRGFAFAGA